MISTASMITIRNTPPKYLGLQPMTEIRTNQEPETEQGITRPRDRGHWRTRSCTESLGRVSTEIGLAISCFVLCWHWLGAGVESGNESNRKLGKIGTCACKYTNRTVNKGHLIREGGRPNRSATMPVEHAERHTSKHKKPLTSEPRQRY